MNAPLVSRHDNNFDFLRLFAASAVVIGHSYWLSGNIQHEPLRQFTGHSDMADVAVNLFFVMSGFLIAASWLNSRSPVDFLGKRALRIFPALFVSVLLGVGLVGSLATQLPLEEYFSDSQTLAYLWNLLLLSRFELPGVFLDNPFPRTVNGSLWTLPYEVGMYLGLLGLGLLRLLHRHLVPLIPLGLMLLHFVLMPRLGIDSELLEKVSRLGMFFFSGTALYLYRAQVPWNAGLALGLLGLNLLTAGSDHWFLVHVLTLPYLAIYLAHLRVPGLARAGRAGDFSYGVYIFSFPLQQLIIWRYPGLSVPAFALLSLAGSLALGVLSWHFIEAPALALKRFLPGARRSARVPVATA